jgi:hypothetical protein
MVQALHMAPLPTPVRAAIGLLADGVDAARTLPERLVELPVLAVSTALQVSLRAQQRYAGWTLRGDELLGRLHQPPEEPPAWATFDDEDPAAAPATAEAAKPPAANAALPEPPATDAPAAPPADAPAALPADAPTRPPSTDNPATALNETGDATLDPLDDVPPPGAASASSANQPQARKAPVRKTTAAAAKTATTKTVRAPRQAKPSAFDRTDDRD